MYTFAPHAPARRSAQTAMHQVVATLAKLLAPVMPFTAEEVWTALPGATGESVHLAPFPKAGGRDVVLEGRWAQLLDIRRVVALELEKARQTGAIGKSLEAQVTIQPADAAAHQLLTELGSLLETVLIVSQVQVGRVTDGDLRVTVARATGQKCVRCWRWTTDVGSTTAHAELCGRCAEVVTQKQ